ncbi:MAG: ABC transporter ATP-binding protein [Caldisphaera sp.]|uniref:ABC transporter ATP-binding protein n=1 Tax=Caldisphaera sp. TaxID=2060322 RepID=UPI000CADC011|nr:MAG: ABC transporter ATP-binding protein [Caldisphaera sp.]
MIEVKNVSKKYKDFKALDNISFNVNNGEVVGFVGINGAGKTTTIKISAGVLKPTTGSVEIDGFDISKNKVEASKRIGWVPELPVFEENFKAIDYFKYLAGYYKIGGKEAEELGIKLFEETGIINAKNKKLKEFSQGMKKRFALAVSMIANPSNYLFDEVLNGLDPQGIVFFREFANRAKKENKAVLFSSHILSEVQNIADRVIIIHKGKILAIKNMDEVVKESKKAIRIAINNPDVNILNVLSKFGEVNKINDDVFEIKGEVSSEYINELLVKAGYKVSKIEQVGGLEEYFLNLIGEKVE